MIKNREAYGVLFVFFAGGLCGRNKMDKENDYVDYFYEKYQGRVAIGVGYNQHFSEIFPLIFENIDGESIGIVALDVILDAQDVVHIYHLGAFITKLGNGSVILKELCRQADIFNIYLSVSAVSMPNGKDVKMDDEHLVEWYERFGFEDDSGLVRKPRNT